MQTHIKERYGRRYLIGASGQLSISTLQYDVVIIGSGIAGIYTALNIDPKLKCAIINKGEIWSGSSYYAQGGIAAVISKEDSSIIHIEDTLAAGAGVCDRKAVEVLVNEGPDAIKRLIEMNVPFDVNSEGELLITKEGGHRERRIVHCGGDATGRETTRRLYEIARTRENIVFYHETSLIDVITGDDGAAGVLVKHYNDFIQIYSPNVILCTGGIGQIYNYTTNPVGAVGDGVAAAQRAGAVIENMEMVQFHPTTLIPQYESNRLFLISEAVRGEGAILKNRFNESFMQGVHPMADLAPRDIVTREILKDLKRTGDSCVYLDVSSMTTEFFITRFPTIYEECKKFNINVTEDKIPVRPAQHYHMGGIKTDLNGKTSVDGLFSCGESACTGIHGANRLASNSVLECLVFGRRCAEYINNRDTAGIKFKPYINNDIYNRSVDSYQIYGFKSEIKTIMSLYAGAVKKIDGLLFAQERINKIAGYLETMDHRAKDSAELYNMTHTAKMVVESALMRKENVGAHYIEE